MKKIATLSLSAFIAFSLILISSCKEVLPEHVVESTLVDTSFVSSNPSSAQNRYVLVEEFTGASCINCPEGHDILKEIADEFGDKVNFIGLHHGGLSEPVYSGEEDLRTDEAASIATQFGSSSMPSALIDRVDINGNYIIGRLSWKALVRDRINVAPKVNLKATSEYSNEKYVYGFEVEFTEEYNNDVSYFISMIEDDIYVSQKDRHDIIPNYKQTHVLRKMYTAYSGKSLSKIDPSVYEKGRIYQRALELEIDNNWNKDNLYVVLYVADNVTSEVLQSNIIKLK